MHVIGAVPTKFVVQAGLLLFTARIDGHQVTAVLDPSSPTTIVASGITPGRSIHIDHSELRLAGIGQGDVPQSAAVVVGADLLREGPLVLDFARGRLRLPGRSEASRLSRKMVEVPLMVASDNCLNLSADAATGAARRVALVGRDDEEDSRSMPVKIGGLAASASPPPEECKASDAAIGWDVFRGHRALFDLAHDRMWISR